MGMTLIFLQKHSESAFTLPERILCLPARSDVLCNLHHANEISMTVKNRFPAFIPYSSVRCVNSHMFCFPASKCPDSRAVRAGTGRISPKFMAFSAHHFRRRKIDGMGCCPVDPDDFQFFVDKGNVDADSIQNCLLLRLAYLQRIFRFPALGDVP